MTDKEIKIEFAPGCFDQFEGTQEELDGLIAEIRRLVDSGELFENSVPIDFDELSEEEEEILMHQISQENSKRNLQ